MPRVSNVFKANHVKVSSCMPSSSSQKQLSKPSTVASKIKSSNQLAASSSVATTAASFAGNCSELDAVNALLTMKSRSSSVPIVSDSQQSEQTKQTSQAIDMAKKGRRKQLLRTPIKNVFTKPPSNYDESSSEARLDEVNLDLNSDNSEENLMFEKESTSFSNKKLLVKFNSLKSSSRVEKTASSYLNIKANDDDDDECTGDDDEEGALKIDEEAQNEPEDLSLKNKVASGTSRQQQQQQDKKKKSPNSDLNNALIELSRSAKHVEENKLLNKNLNLA